MASAVIATRNDTTWPTNHPQPRTAGSGFMGKFPFLNNHPNPNPNSNSKFNDDFHNPTVSDDAASFSHRRPNPNPNFNSFSHYVSFDISSCSRLELRSLKARLMSELDRVRSLSTRIESGELRKVSSNSKKRPMPFSQPNKDSKRFASSQQSPYMASAQVMKMCGQVLTKLVKQKAGYVFNTPVNAVELGLHDYHQIIKHPMDLGTIKVNLGKNLYPTPEDFAADVRLTFDNALRYNPKGHEVHILAEHFLAKFEQIFKPVYHKFQLEKIQNQHQTKKQENGPKEDGLVVVDQVPKMVNPLKKHELVEPPRSEPPPRPTLSSSPAPTPAPCSQVVAAAPVKVHAGRMPNGKLPKPKAKDPNKRDMSMEEKHKLGAGLQSLPEEKMVQVIQIIRKRNGNLTQDGDEIELDIEAVDTETLWELDRFATNYKKMASKIKRQGLMDFPNNIVGHPHDDATNQVVVSERIVETGKTKKGGGDVGEEDVDIGDEMPVTNFPPLEIEKDDDRHQGGASSSSSGSSSSRSDSSSSSDSDSGSSSGSDSDVDDAQSRDDESKNIHH